MFDVFRQVHKLGNSLVVVPPGFEMLLIYTNNVDKSYTVQPLLLEMISLPTLIWSPCLSILIYLPFFPRDSVVT